MRNPYARSEPRDVNGMRRMDERVHAAFEEISRAVNSFRATDVKTSAYVAQDWDLVLVDPTDGAFTVQLGAPGLARKSIKNVTTSTNQVTILPPDGTLVDGASSLAMTTARQYVELAPANGAWHVVGGYP